MKKQYILECGWNGDYTKMLLTSEQEALLTHLAQGGWLMEYDILSGKEAVCNPRYYSKPTDFGG